MNGAKSLKTVAICAGGIRNGDAVGIDILGMAESLRASGYRVTLVAFSIEDSIRQQYHASSFSELNSFNDFDMVIYHHCIVLPEIEPLLDGYNGRLIIRYHNITPATFFSPYPAAAHAQAMCAQGREQTRRLVERFWASAYWMPASEYNVQDLSSLLPAQPMQHLGVVPPFNRLEQFRANMPTNTADITTTVELLFVGRFSPNKNHLDMVRTLYTYIQTIDSDIHLTLVGSQDPALQRYMDQLNSLITALGLEAHVSILSHVPEEELKALYGRASVFFCMSLHEGFCVPVIEAQALGLPVLTTTTAAIGETLGPQQFGFERPESTEDYLYIAQLIYQASHDKDVRQALVEQGYRNISQRFSGEIIAEKFQVSIYDAVHNMEQRA